LGKLGVEDEQIIDESLDLVDMLSFKQRKLNTLSDGERQRVMIAKALAQQSDIMILDEPTAHLDLINRVEIMKLLRELAHKQNRAILISTHELDLAMQSADVLWLMRDDKKISVGAPEDLILNQSMQEVFAQSSVDFDHLSGMFKIKHEINTQMHFTSDDAQKALWTRKALEKIGVDLIDDVNIENSIHYLSSSNTWKVSINGTEGSFNSLGDVVAFVTSI
jgi:iron complex transport system ATP-binding protein